MDQPSHHLDRGALRADDVTPDDTLDDLEMTHAPDDHAFVELDQLLREQVQLFELPASRVHVDERKARLLVRGPERLPERLRDTAQLPEAGRVEAAAVSENLAHLGVLPRRHVLE